MIDDKSIEGWSHIPANIDNLSGSIVVRMDA